MGFRTAQTVDHNLYITRAYAVNGLLPIASERILVTT